MPDRIRSLDDVCEVLAELFRGHGAFVSTPGEVESQVNWRRRFLMHDLPAWRALVLRAQAEAGGFSAAGRARGLGWTRSRFERAWRRGAAAIVEGIARERVNAAAIDAGLAAEDRLEAAGRLVKVAIQDAPSCRTAVAPSERLASRPRLWADQ
ncbi:hypothetical protein [Enterovirga rhinocerotis]|uniref:Uncharacterized protein n=1 Tax=Enterovirga rhinocerotis TaxID=1339210 RepID=A0A4R7C7N7_9HYPH|nr:hypothetical protein [Enterovirga rhinocerotis]TDR94183.1 hypothetical protein EV668_1461 [Enterovirga rhinocerotis]